MRVPALLRFEKESVALPIFGGKSGRDYTKIKFQSDIRMACNLGYLTNGLPENETKYEEKCQADF